MGSYFRIQAQGLTDVGPKRDHNEDQFMIARELRLFLVADGMGGHEAGDVASQMAAVLVLKHFRSGDGLRSAFEAPAIEKRSELEPGAQLLLASVMQANRAIVEKGGGEAAAKHGGMGSTIVTLHMPRGGDRVHVCHLGDSRCYRLRGGELVQLTRDHNMVNDALRLNPDTDPEILAQLPSNVVTRALGMLRKAEPDVSTEILEDGDLFLLCSDGLSGPVEDPAIARVLIELSGDLSTACDELVAMANQSGDDNVTVLLVRFVEAG